MNISRSSIQNSIKNYPVRAATLAGLFQQACSAGSMILLFPFIISNLSGADSGLWFSFQGFVAVAGLCDFGLGFVVARQTSYSLAQTTEGGISGDFIDFGSGPDGVRRMRRHVEKIYNRTGAAAVIVGIVIYEAILPHTKALDGVTDDSRLVWYFMLATGLFLLQVNRWNSILNGAHNVFTARIIFGLFFLLQGISVAIAAIITESVLVMSIVSLAVALIYFQATKFAAIKTIPELSTSTNEPIDSELVKRLWKVAVPVGCTNTSSFLITSAQVPMLGALLGPSYVAPFYLAQRLLQFSAMVAQQPITSQLAQFTSALSRMEKARANQIMRKSLLVFFPLVFLACLGFFIFSPMIASFLAEGEDYPSTIVLLLMGLNTMLLSMAAVCGQFVMASGKNPFMWITIVNGILSILSLVFLVPRFGLVGIPAGALLAGLISSYTYCFYKWAHLNHEMKNAVSQ